MDTQTLISLLILGSIVIPIGGGLIILLRNELVTDKSKTGGDGMIVLVGMFIVFVILPVIVFLTSL